MAQENAAVTFKEYGLQDANTLEATQTMLESRVLERFPLMDQEVLCRHLHKVAANGWTTTRRSSTRRYDDDGQDPVAGEFADLEPFAATWCLATEPERFAQRLASTMDEMQAFYDAVTPRAEDAMTYLRPSPSTTCPRTG